MARKIKSIEVEAFRGYDSKQVFNLTTVDGRLANLNVLYAPNGFGKTSFIDAVEWSLTGQITRFQNSIIFNTADRHAGHILHNYDSVQSVGTVQIVFEDGTSITRSTKNNRRNRRWDFNEGKLIDEAGLLISTGKGGYRIVDTLTQESTDQSVCFTTPEQRFDALRPLWDSNNDTYIYKSLLGMGKAARDQKKELEADINNLISDIQISFKDQGISALLNQQLGLLNEVSLYQVEVFPEDLTPGLLNRRLELLLKLRNDTTLEISSIKEVLDILSNLQIRFDGYNNHSLVSNSINKEIEALNSTILDANKLTISLDLLQKSRERRSFEIIKINKLNSLADIASDFLHIIASIDNNNKNILLIDERLQECIYRKSTLVSLSTEKNRQIVDAQARISSIESDIELVSNNYAKLSLLIKDKEIVSVDVVKVQLQIEQLKDNLEDILLFINKIKGFLNNDKGFFLNTEFIEVEQIDIQNAFTHVKDTLLILKQKEQALQLAEDNFNKLKSSNDTLSEIISAGKRIVSQTQSKTCPLCTTEFNDFNQLLASIDKQRIDLDKIVDLDYHRKDLDYFTKEHINSVNLFNAEAERLIKDQESRLLDIRNTLSLAENNIYSLKNHVGRIDLEINNINSFFASQLTEVNDESIARTTISFTNALSELKDNIIFTSSEIREGELLISEFEKELVLLNNAKNKYEIDTSSKRNSPIYNYGFELLKDTGIALDNINKLNVLIDNIRKNIDELTNRIDAEELSINNYFESTQGKSLEEINADIIILRSNASYAEREMELYISDWQKVMNSQENEFNLIKLSKKVNDINQKLYTLTIASSRFNDLISFIESLKKGVELNSQLVRKQEELQKVNNALKNLESARDKSISYIERKIAQEFNEKLINDIYQKVEPHPTLKEIKFVPELDGDKAKLDILVRNTSKQGYSKAPVVYFSAAQINILSLSIFLAKSLQNEHKVVNTIFMDDPIQFLDSINTLSFIDLIRVITSEKGLNQQVFISTHDETFFKLLKRKIDPNYYASNFIELETFGVIKTL